MKNALVIILSLFIFSSCKKNLPNPGGTAVQNFANEWWVTYTSNDTDVLGIGHIKIATYNSAANTNEIWIDDLRNGRAGYNFKVKAQTDNGNLTFTSTGANQYYNSNSPASYPQTVTITNGKILPGQAHSRTGNVTDSIYMQAVFSNRPGTTFTIAGYARTRWPEDDY